MRKTNQSSLARLRREGWGGEGGRGSVTGGLLWQGFEVARGAQDDGRLALLVFRGGLHLIAREFEDDAVPLAGCGNEMQRLPVDGDLAIADAEKPAEVDDGGAHPAFAIDQYVDDPSHILVRQAAHIPAENALRFLGFEDGDGWRCSTVGLGRSANGDQHRRQKDNSKPVPHWTPPAMARGAVDQLVAVGRVAFPGASEVLSAKKRAKSATWCRACAGFPAKRRRGGGGP